MSETGWEAAVPPAITTEPSGFGAEKTCERANPTVWVGVKEPLSLARKGAVTDWRPVSPFEKPVPRMTTFWKTPGPRSANEFQRKTWGCPKGLAPTIGWADPWAGVAFTNVVPPLFETSNEARTACPSGAKTL